MKDTLEIFARMLHELFYYITGDSILMKILVIIGIFMFAIGVVLYIYNHHSLESQKPPQSILPQQSPPQNSGDSGFVGYADPNYYGCFSKQELRDKISKIEFEVRQLDRIIKEEKGKFNQDVNYMQRERLLGDISDLHYAISMKNTDD